MVVIMAELASKRRAWIKNIIIIFLLIMLFLTFFSNTILNYSLPEVSAQYASYGSITSRIKATGTISAVSTYKVFIEESRVIESIAVRTGDAVEKGQLLFTLEKSESGELKTAVDELNAAKEALEDLKTAYQKYLVNVSPEYSSDYANLQKALDAYNEAIAEANKLDGYKSAYTAALSAKTAADAQVKTIEAKIEKIDEQISEINKQISKISETDLVQDNIASQLAAAKNKLASLLVTKNNAERTLENAKAAANMYSGSLPTAKENLDTLIARKSALEGVKSSYRALDDMVMTINADKSELTQVAGNIKTAEDKKPALESNAASLETLYDAAVSAYDKYIEDNSDENGVYDVTAQGYIDAKAAMDKAKKDYDDANNELIALNSSLDALKERKSTLEKSISDQQLQIDRAKTDLRIQGYNYDTYTTAALESDLISLTSQITTLQNSYDSASGADERAKAALAAAETAFETAKTDYAAAEAEVKRLEASQSSDALTKQLKEAETNKKAAETELDRAKENVTKAETNVQNADNDVKSAEAAKENAKTLKETYDSQKKAYDQAQVLSGYDDKDKLKEISKQETVVAEKNAAVEKLKEKESGSTEVLSKVAGTVSSIDCYAGQTVDRETVLANLEITDKGYTVEVSVTSDQARQLKVGDAAVVQNNWYMNAEATITSIKTDPYNPSTNRLVTLMVTGNVSAGQSITLALGEKSTSYETTVPNSAVYEDNKGKFVLSVEVKSSPLGTRYTARRVDITVVSSDDTSSAVSGLMGSEFVIISSTKPVTDGQQVKLVET